LRRPNVWSTSQPWFQGRSRKRQGSSPRLLALVLAPMAACTFPDVEYETPSADQLAPACDLPAVCQTPADHCAKKAASNHDACIKKCGVGIMADCGACDAAQEEDLSKCLVKCETCSSTNGCADAATTSCKAALGIP